MSARHIARAADRIADSLRGSVPTDWDLLRDICDQKTGGDFDCLQLDLLTDCVQVRLKKES